MLTLCALLFLAPEIGIELVDGAITVRGATTAIVRVGGGTPAEIAARPPVLGSWKSIQGGMVFEPRFPLSPGVRYRVEVSDTISRELMLPKIERKPTAIIEHVFPSSDVLPENHLRFYLHFSAPMRQGEVYRHIRLLDEKGKAIESPWLELDEELWDADSRRFTLLIHPGRIKQGLRPREDLGPVLEPNKRYTLVVDAAWEDENGTPMRQSYRKSFRVESGTDRPIDPKRWQITAPNRDGKQPLTIRFERPLDHALIRRMLIVVDGEGKKIDGTIAVSEAETVWRFTATKPLTPGNYAIIANTALEDLAGNRIDRPFEVDVVRPVEREIKTETVRIPFIVR